MKLELLAQIDRSADTNQAYQRLRERLLAKDEAGVADLSLELLSAGRPFSEILGEAVSAIGTKAASLEKPRHVAATASQGRFGSVPVSDAGVSRQDTLPNSIQEVGVHHRGTRKARSAAWEKNRNFAVLLAICGICGAGAGLAQYPLVFEHGAGDSLGTVPQISVQVLPPAGAPPSDSPWIDPVAADSPATEANHVVDRLGRGYGAKARSDQTPAPKDKTDQTELPDFAQRPQPTAPELADPDRQAMAAMKRLSRAAPAADTTAIERERFRRE